MQQANLTNPAAAKDRHKKTGRKAKVGMFNRFEVPCRQYIEKRAKQLGISQIQFLQNCVGLAGPTMPNKFKFIFTANGNSHGKK